jgi:hypothetical protein
MAGSLVRQSLLLAEPQRWHKGPRNNFSKRPNPKLSAGNYCKFKYAQGKW